MVEVYIFVKSLYIAYPKPLALIVGQAQHM